MKFLRCIGGSGKVVDRNSNKHHRGEHGGTQQPLFFRVLSGCCWFFSAFSVVMPTLFGPYTASDNELNVKSRTFSVGM